MLSICSFTNFFTILIHSAIWYCRHAHEHVFSTSFSDLPSDPETLGGTCAWDAGGSMDLDSRDKQRTWIHTDPSHICNNLLRQFNKSDLPRPNNPFRHDSSVQFAVLAEVKCEASFDGSAVCQTYMQQYDGQLWRNWNSTLKFYNCHVKHSEIWLVLPTPEQRKSTVWTQISCQAISPTNGLGTRLTVNEYCSILTQMDCSWV